MSAAGVRVVTAIAALLGCCALALQAGLTIDLLIEQEGLAPAHAVWRFLGWFTVLANLFCAAVLTNLVLRPEATTGLADPRVMLAAASSITLVGVVYSVAVRGLRDLTGLDPLADRLLHGVMPVLFVVAWLVRPHGGLRWRDALWCAVFPGFYSAYALARGAVDGWRAYWFLDPTQATLPEVARNIGIVLAVLPLIGLAFVGLDGILARKRPAS